MTNAELEDLLWHAVDRAVVQGLRPPKPSMAEPRRVFAWLIEMAKQDGASVDDQAGLRLLTDDDLAELDRDDDDDVPNLLDDDDEDACELR